MLCYRYEQSIFNKFNVKSIYNSKSLIIQYLVKGIYTHVKFKKKIIVMFTKEIIVFSIFFYLVTIKCYNKCQ